MRMHRMGALLAVPLLAACAAGTGPPAASGSGSPSPSASSELRAYRALVACLRRNGAPDFPDPTVDAEGNVQLSTSAQVTARTKRACSEEARRLQTRKKGPEYTAAEVAKLRQLARCFRANGLPDWPDPDATGAFPLPERLAELGKRAWTNLRPQCRQYMVGTGIVVRVQGTNR